MRHFKGVLSLIAAGAIALATGLAAADGAWTGSNTWPQFHPHKDNNPLSAIGTQVYFGPAGKAVPMDSDGDGVYDDKDKCPGTPKGTQVDADGCPLKAPPAPGDEDKDGVTDDKDKCPGTPKGAKVNSVGCWIIEGIRFDTGKSVIKPVSFPGLEDVAKVLKDNPGMKVEIQGHTDNKGSAKLNKPLSENRAKAVKTYLAGKGVAADRMTTAGYSFDRPVGDNKTEEGRAQNRRVELHPSK